MSQRHQLVVMPVDIHLGSGFEYLFAIFVQFEVANGNPLMLLSC